MKQETKRAPSRRIAPDLGALLDAGDQVGFGVTPAVLRLVSTDTSGGYLLVGRFHGLLSYRGSVQAPAVPFPDCNVARSPD